MKQNQNITQNIFLLKIIKMIMKIIKINKYFN